jgi:hypothetical protein
MRSTRGSAGTSPSRYGGGKAAVSTGCGLGNVGPVRSACCSAEEWVVDTLPRVRRGRRTLGYWLEPRWGKKPRDAPPRFGLASVVSVHSAYRSAEEILWALYLG